MLPSWSPRATCRDFHESCPHLFGSLSSKGTQEFGGQGLLAQGLAQRGHQEMLEGEMGDPQGTAGATTVRVPPDCLSLG